MDALHWKEAVLVLLQWVETRGPTAWLWIVVLQAAQVVLVIPGPFFTVAAGFLFGIWGGLWAGMIGTLVGSVLAYALARLFPESRGGWAERGQWAALLERLLKRGDWKLVLMTRLIPLFPFKLSNYLFGWARFRFGAFLLGTVVGVIPMTAVSVSAGSFASDLSQVVAHGGRTGARWPLSLAGLAAAIGLSVYAGYRGRARLRQLRAAPGKGEKGVERRVDGLSYGTHAAASPLLSKDPNRERDSMEGGE